MVGGRSPLARDERLLRFEFPGTAGRADEIPLVDGAELEHQPLPLPQPGRGLQLDSGGHPGAAGRKCRSSTASSRRSAIRGGTKARTRFHKLFLACRSWPHGFALEDKLVVAISSRALFDFEEENRGLRNRRPRRIRGSCSARGLSVPAKPGVAFPLIRKLLALNAGAQHVEVVILSRSDPISGLRAFSSCTSARARDRARRRSPPRARAVRVSEAAAGVALPLSANPDDVRAALGAGLSRLRACCRKRRALASRYPDEIRIAFDGDAVLFSDEAERVFQSDGLSAFVGHETHQKDSPLAGRAAQAAAGGAAPAAKRSRMTPRRCTSAPRWSPRVPLPRTSARSER